MDLKPTKIPPEFLQVLPEGIKFLHKHGIDFLVVEEVHCPKGHNLVVETVKIHGEPSIKIDVEIEGERGSFFIDAFWGSHSKLYSFIPPLKSRMPIVKAFCPTCGESLTLKKKCGMETCESETNIVLHLPGSRNKIYVCAALGCPGHFLDVSSLPPNLAETVSEINYFGAQSEDDIFKGI